MNYEYTVEEFQETAKLIYKELIKDIKPVSNPYGILIGGQPGAGKTILQKLALAEDSNVIIINGDEFRKKHPRYKDIVKNENDYVHFTQKFCGQMIEYLVNRLSSEKYNLFVEGTLRTYQVPLFTKELLKEKGYSVNLHIMAVSREESWQGTIDRYNEMKKYGLVSRKTTREAHDLVANNIVDNLKYLFLYGNFDNIRLYKRSGECVYDMLKETEIKPYEILDNILNSGYIKRSIRR